MIYWGPLNGKKLLNSFNKSLSLELSLKSILLKETFFLKSNFKNKSNFTIDQNHFKSLRQERLLLFDLAKINPYFGSFDWKWTVSVKSTNDKIWSGSFEDIVFKINRLLIIFHHWDRSIWVAWPLTLINDL